MLTKTPSRPAVNFHGISGVTEKLQGTGFSNAAQRIFSWEGISVAIGNSLCSSSTYDVESEGKSGKSWGKSVSSDPSANCFSIAAGTSVVTSGKSGSPTEFANSSGEA